MALLNFSYNKIEAPFSRSDNGEWDEGEWLELASRPRFWPGFIEGFLSDPQIRKDMIEYFGELEGIPQDKMVGIIADPLNPVNKERLVNMIQDFQFDYEIWEGSDDPWHLILTMTPGYFEYNARVVGDRIHYEIYEIVTELTPAVEQPDPDMSPDVIANLQRGKNDKVHINQGAFQELAKALGFGFMSVMNRREV